MSLTGKSLRKVVAASDSLGASASKVPFNNGLGMQSAEARLPPSLVLESHTRIERRKRRQRAVAAPSSRGGKRLQGSFQQRLRGAIS